jgi:hypothetical protein
MVNEMDKQNLMRKAEFARRCGVSRTRTSQWIKAGQIDGTALVGTGRDMRIDADVALKQLRTRLDPDQRFGAMGLSTRLDWSAADAAGDVAADADDIAFVERHRGVAVDLADVERLLDENWISFDFTVREALKAVPKALEAYTAIRPQLAAIKDAIVLAP